MTVFLFFLHGDPFRITGSFRFINQAHNRTSRQSDLYQCRSSSRLVNTLLFWFCAHFTIKRCKTFPLTPCLVTMVTIKVRTFEERLFTGHAISIYFLLHFQGQCIRPLNPKHCMQKNRTGTSMNLALCLLSYRKTEVCGGYLNLLLIKMCALQIRVRSLYLKGEYHDRFDSVCS